jgi:predicted TIM-barrel fold metal-dependent hydrolase
MDVFEKVVSDNRNVTFIGAHQMHVGPETMDRLFADHPNLVTDTSCGCMLRQFDQMRPDDCERWRAFFLRHTERLLFGTDTALSEKAHFWNLWDALGNHIRFVHALRLPQDVLGKVMHGNFERVAGLEPPEPDQHNWGASRA